MTDAFTWGPGGEAQTTSSQSRRRLAEALMREGTSGAPIQSWTQGLNRVAQALMGGYDLRQEDERDRRLEHESADIISNHPAFAGMGGAASPAVARVAAAMPGNTVAASNTDPGKVWSQDELNPMDPPSGNARDMLVRTVMAESGNQPDIGQNAVASVIRNRAINGGYGGDTVPGVVQAPSQFEPWGTQAGRDRMAAIDPNSPQYQRASGMVDQAYAGNDPTNGATHFYSPTAQAALGRPAPAWDNGTGVDIAQHRFFGGAPGTQASADPAALPPNAQPTQGYAAPGQSAQPPAGPQMPPAVASWVQRAIRNPATRGSAMQVLAQYSKPRETYAQESDDQGNIWSVNQQTGQRTVALKRDKPEADPTSVREHNHYLQTFRPTAQQPEPMGYDTWATAKARAAATNVTTNVGGGTDKQIFDEFVERSKSARSTAQGLSAIRNARDALTGEGGSITGFRADERLSLQKAAAYFGITDTKAIQNTETFRAAIAPQVAAVMKATVGNANISDSDRRFAEKAAGGSIELDGGSIKRLLDIMERASIAQLQDHAEQLEAVYPDANAHKRERALFGIKVPTGSAPPAGATKSGIKWSVE